jgi:hypothetical protein
MNAIVETVTATLLWKECLIVVVVVVVVVVFYV